MTTKTGRFEKYFNEVAIRMDQSSKDGKTLVSTESMSQTVNVLAKLCKELQK